MKTAAAAAVEGYPFWGGRGQAQSGGVGPTGFFLCSSPATPQVARDVPGSLLYWHIQPPPLGIS